MEIHGETFFSLFFLSSLFSLPYTREEKREKCLQWISMELHGEKKTRDGFLSIQRPVVHVLDLQPL